MTKSSIPEIKNVRPGILPKESKSYIGWFIALPVAVVVCVAALVYAVAVK